MKCVAEVMYQIVPFAWIGVIAFQTGASVFLGCRCHLCKLPYVVG